MDPIDETKGDVALVSAVPDDSAVQADVAPVADAAPAAPDAQMPETPAEAPPPNFSDTFRGKMKAKNGDQDFPDDESFFKKASEELDNLEAYRNNNMEANKALMGIFDAEPAIAEVLKDMVQGASFREALARHFSPDELTPQEGDPDREGWARNAEAREKKLAANELTAKQMVENNEFSTKSIQEFAKETNLSEEKATEFLNQVGEALDEVYSGKISKSFLMSMYKALNHENDVKVAESNGIIKGKNEKIDVKKESKPAGDGLPNISGGEKPPTVESKNKSWIDNLADTEKRKQIL
jgi:hypothetical protein